MLKLNGGLGTGMGLEKAKSLLPVKQGYTFLEMGCLNSGAKRPEIIVPPWVALSFL